MSQSVIRFDTVTKSFGALNAVHGITFSAAAGETAALLGPSVCGKTTTLHLIAGFEDANSSATEIAAKSMVGKRPFEHNVGLPLPAQRPFRPPDRHREHRPGTEASPLAQSRDRRLHRRNA